MTRQPNMQTASVSHDAGRRWLPPLVIVVSAVICYANSFDGTFVFDDRQYVANNPALHTLWPPYDWLAFCPTRPLVYFTFAVNYALGGEEVFGYHLVNLLIHIATALALFGLTRRSLQSPVIHESLRNRATLIATVSALIWTVHPLCTQAVTYVYQRLESLAAMFAVLSCYALARAYEYPSQTQRRWVATSLLCCCAAMLSKESVAGLPVILLLYDRIFLGGSWRGVLTHRRYHLAAFCSWGLALGLMVATGDAYAKSGITNVPGMTSWLYLRSQSGVILRYLQLIVWPTGQCLDYGWPTATEFGEWVPQSIVILTLLIATCVGLYRGRAWSFPAAAFFLLLAPTSSIIPIADLLFEHRMYLPAAAVVVLLVCGFARGLDALNPRFISQAAGRRFAGLAVCASVAALGTTTVIRNRVYADELTLWQEILVKAPHNPRGPYLLGGYYLHHEQRELAEAYLNRCLAVCPLFVPAHTQRIELLIADGRLAEAEENLNLLESAIPFEPTVATYAASIQNSFGNLRMEQGRNEEAMRRYLKALEIDPGMSQAMSSLAMLMAAVGRYDEALGLFQQSIYLRPDDPAVHNNLGVIYRGAGKYDEAAAAFRAALEIAPKSSEARANLGSILELQGRGDEAMAELTRAVEMDADYIGARINLGTALARRGRFNEAKQHLQRAVELDPLNETARANLKQVEQDLAARPSSAIRPAR